MPLKLIPPRPGKTPYWAVRGTYLGKYVDRSTKACRRAVAAQIMRQWERDIERGEFSTEGKLTFAAAALSYMQNGGERERMVKLLEYFRETPIAAIDQQAIDACAIKLCPTQSPATRNRDIYTPISAVLKHAGVAAKLRRPKGWRGVQRTDWLDPGQAFAVFAAADEFDPEFGLFLRFLCYTGVRSIAEALAIRCDKLNLQEAYVQVVNTKNGETMGVFLPPVLVAALANHPRGLERPGEKLFRFIKCGRLYTKLQKVGAKVPGVHLTFHLFRHTWATWMRRYAGTDCMGLVATQRWKDPASVRRYQHVIVSEESRRAALLPVPPAKAGNAP